MVKNLGDNLVYYGQKIFDLIWVSLLWVVGSIPIITVGTSTTALYYAVHRAWVEDKGYITDKFWSSYKQNLKQGICLWIMIVAISIIIHLDCSVIMAFTDSQAGGTITAFYYLISLLLLGVFAYMFASLSRYEMPIGWFIKIGCYMAVRYFGRTLLLIGILSVSLWLITYIPLMILVVPGIEVLLSEKILEPVLVRHEPKEDE